MLLKLHCFLVFFNTDNKLFRSKGMLFAEIETNIIIEKVL